MRKLPLFPLHMVAFPGAPVHLHIFEERYKEMLLDCESKSGEFIIALIARGAEVGDALPATFSTACLMEILEIKKLAVGKFNITAIGKQRLKLESLDTSRTYLQSDFREFPLAEKNSGLCRNLSEQLKTLFAKQFQVERGTSPGDSSFPDSPETMAFLACHFLKLDNARKQKLLESPDVDTLLQKILSLYEDERRLFLHHKPDSVGQYGPFSPN